MFSRKELIQMLNTIENEIKDIKEKLDNLNNHTLKMKIGMIGNKTRLKLGV